MAALLSQSGVVSKKVKKRLKIVLTSKGKSKDLPQSIILTVNTQSASSNSCLYLYYSYEYALTFQRYYTLRRSPNLFNGY